MTKLLGKALAAVRRLSPEGQDEIAHALLQLVGEAGEPEAVPPEHLAAVLASHRLGAVISRARPKWRPRSAASTDEAALQATSRCDMGSDPSNATSP